MARIRALLVGINAYTAVTPLKGCVADIESVAALLQKRVQPPDTLELKVLRDAEATRAAIIDGFTSHLAAAGPGDIALFYYCGHGSEESPPEEWKRFATGGMQQTIVPVDARIGDTFEIADKELAALIHAVAETGAQVVTIFDSCHSGGVTRHADAAVPAAVRMAAASTMRPRTLADYLDGARALYDPERVKAHGDPAPRHLAIAACEYDQLAKEVPESAPARGAFTQAFEEAVTALGSTATYADLVTMIRSRVRTRAKAQVPNIAAIGGADPATLFLGGAAGRADLTLDCADGTWWLSAGEVDGIPMSGAGEVTTIDIHPRGALARGTTPPKPVARGRVEEVQAQRSRVTITDGSATLDPGLPYVCRITSQGAPAITVLVAGPDDAGVARVRDALTLGVGQYALAAGPGGTVPTITVHVEGGRITVRGEDGAPLQNLAFDADIHGCDSTVAACSHIARWYGIRDRRPLTPGLNNAVRLEVIPAGGTGEPAPVGPEGVVLHYANGTPPLAQFRLRNTANRRLWVVLLDLADSFQSKSMFDGSLQPGEAKDVYAEAKPVSVGRWRDASYPNAVDWLKVFASEEALTPSTLELPALLKAPADASRGGAVFVDEDTSTWGVTMLRLETRR